MADARTATASARFVVSVAAVATTLGSSVAMAVHGAPRSSAEDLDVPSLSPLPTLEPTIDAPPVPARRPAPMATTRSSR